ncbi:hypothetical protein ABT096_29530 [Streptomyces sp. NPDC002561]|uniref:hypothetical protein n=1 Tax=Streptomyces sp. NPDC002561 TaxID=3154418 RepID=UPI0033340625
MYVIVEERKELVEVLDMQAYRIKGTTADVTACELCGKQELNGTVVLAPLDVDGAEGDVCYFGTSCAAKAAGWTVKDVKAGIKAATDAKREAERMEREAEDARYQEFKTRWYVENYGTADPHEAAKMAGMSAARLSDMPLQAYKEAQKTADDVADVAPAVITPCPVQAQPGNYHFEGRCADCDALYLSKMSRDDVEYRYQTGRVSQDQFEAYMHVWATSAIRHSAREWEVVPTDPEVLAIVAAIRRHAGIPAPMGLTA